MLNNITMLITFLCKNKKVKVKVFLMEITNKERKYYNKSNITQQANKMTGERKRKVVLSLTTNFLIYNLVSQLLMLDMVRHSQISLFIS